MRCLWMVHLENEDKVHIKNLLLMGGRGPKTKINKTISDGGITVDFPIIKVHTSN